MVSNKSSESQGSVKMAVDQPTKQDDITIHCLYDELLSVKKAKKHPKNNNKHPQEQIDRLSKIIQYQGFRQPIKISKQTGYITSGHGRLLAAIRSGMKKVPVVYQEYKDIDQEIADLYADNAVASWADFDLSMVNDSIGEFDPSFDIELLGIKDFKLDPADNEPLIDEDEIPAELPEPKAKLGQIYKLGDHRLMCGDSTEIEQVNQLMDGQKADMVFTDPTYNTGMTSEKQKGSGGLWKGNKKNGKARLSHMFNDDYTPEEWDSFLSAFLNSYFESTKENCALYISLDWRRSHELVDKAKHLFKFSNLIVWDKVVHGLGSDYKYTHEFIHVFKKGKPNIDSHQGDKEYSDVWHIQRKMGKDEDHATKKPIELIERPIKHASKAQDVVLDLFGGSGSTLIACEKTNRKCYMMELDPHYVDVIINRWEKYTGKKAELING